MTPEEAFARLGAALAGLPPLRAALAGGPERRTVGGLWGSSSSLAVALLARGADRRVLVVTPAVESAEGLALDLAALAPGLPVSLLPVAEEGLADGPELRANLSERLVALASLGSPGDGVLVVPGPVLLEDMPESGGGQVVLRKGQRLDREGLVRRLAAEGYARTPLVASPGEFSLRGDILDVYAWASPAPLRIELWDDEIEELRRFEVDSQRSIASLEEAALPTGGVRQTRGRGLLEHVDARSQVLVLDRPRVKDRLAEVAFERSLHPRRVEGALAGLSARPGVELSPFDSGVPEQDVSLLSVGAQGRPTVEAVAAFREEGRHVVLLCDASAEAERLRAALAEAGLVEDERLALIVARVTSGFRFAGDGPVLAHHHELIGRRPVRRQRPPRTVASRALDSLSELQPGDVVVHLIHGVGIYRGMERLAREKGEEDHLVLEFAEQTTLYVPASRIDLVERFIGADAGRPPALDRIGGRSWSRKKEKVARAVEDLASQLLDTAARRQAERGFRFPPEDAAQLRFEQAFPYEDTPDQHRAWAEVQGDLEGPRSMDRLLVGDVGFGKTEVAVRAAYKCVLARKQVAVLVPTTILAEQHFDTFSRRMAEEPVAVEVLSRFRSSREQKDVLERTAAGQVDVLIGTHRLLSADVRFADLGLLVVDEEQRFGVAHKEKLKHWKATVDVLTLSATPIPRTLHMALSGLRDISAIETPPPGRRPVLTKVSRDDDAVLRAALLHEIGRGGQVFVLHNRVQSIGRVLERVRTLLPTARTALAHGQMAAEELQEVVEAFARGDVDVLVCTAIIESGIDIPRANTIVVTDSQHFGLADLHQLRGRVGRERTQAYAHFLVPRDEPLPPQAEQRLKAIEEFSSLGAGKTISLRDLELRGAGNLLGAEQSGHILAVGYDMYCRLLRAAVSRARGQRPPEEPGETEVELGLSAFLPPDFVPEESARLGLLRRLSRASPRTLDQIEREMQDRFGRLPEPALDLLDLFRLRRLVRLAGAASLLTDGLGGAVVTLRDERAWGRRGPFHPPEAFVLSPRKLRHPWPRGVETPRQRLGYLLRRFTQPEAVPSR